MATASAGKLTNRATLLNFVVSGEVRSGTSVVQSALCKTSQAVCHNDLFYGAGDTPQENGRVRREAHEGYFGPAAEGEWFVDGETNPCRYLTEQVWDNPREGEQACGVVLSYRDLRRFDIFDLLEDRCREGDFCVVDVVRNPVACLVSYQQARQLGLWRLPASDPAGNRVPPAVRLDPEELTAFVRSHEAARLKLHAACDDLLVVRYRDLHLDYDRQMAAVCEFLELDLPRHAVPTPAYRRLRNRDIRSRVSNFAGLRREVPSDVRRHLEAEDLF